VNYYAYGGGALLAALFNAAAVFAGMSMAAALVGIFFSMFGALGSMDMRGPVRWALTAVVAYSLMVVLRADVVVVDRMAESVGPGGLHGDGSYSRIPVADIPIVLAVAGHASSLVGVTLSDAFETLLGIPEERQIGAGGLFVVHRTLRAMMGGIR